MPVIKSAKKKLRKDIKREKINSALVGNLKKSIKKARKTPTAKIVAEATRALDRAAKRKLIHKNKASRIKSQLSKLLKPGSKSTADKTPKKKPVSK